jgi:hypothetical protein
MCRGLRLVSKINILVNVSEPQLLALAVIPGPEILSLQHSSAILIFYDANLNLTPITNMSFLLQFSYFVD